MNTKQEKNITIPPTPAPTREYIRELMVAPYRPRLELIKEKAQGWKREERFSGADWEMALAFVFEELRVLLREINQAANKDASSKDTFAMLYNRVCQILEGGQVAVNETTIGERMTMVLLKEKEAEKKAAEKSPASKNTKDKLTAKRQTANKRTVPTSKPKTTKTQKRKAVPIT